MTQPEMLAAAAFLRLAGERFHGDAVPLETAIPAPDERAALLQAYRVHEDDEGEEPEPWALMLFLADRLARLADWAPAREGD